MKITNRVGSMSPRGREEIKMSWSEVFGDGMTAAEITSQAREEGVSVAGWLATQYRELGEKNPDGGWDEAHRPDFEAMAQEIEHEIRA